LERATAGQSAEAEEALQAVYDDRVDAFGGAVRRVMLAGAPDFAAFAAKLELFFEYELEPDSVDEDCLAAMLADARRLAG
jgi:DNA-directed RNA polymerase alpha subunit